MTAYDHLEPDHLLVGFYSGNDFLDAAKRVEGQAKGGMTRPWSYKAKLRKAQRIHDGAVAQILNQAFYFKSFPHMKPHVLDRVERIFQDMHRNASLIRKTLAVLIIPTKWDLEQSRIGAEFFGAAEALGLVHEDLNIASRMSSELSRRLISAGICILTPSAETLRSSSPLFWERDYHLNATGHRLLAQLSVSILLTQLSTENGYPGPAPQD
jgi:hypothetical protein